MSKKRKRLSKATRGGHAGKKSNVTLPLDPWSNRPDTDAQREGTTIRDVEWTDPETGEKKNPNGLKYIFREPVLERMHRQGKLTDRTFSAAKKIRDAFEEMQKQPPAIKAIQVDTSPDPSGIIAMQADKQSWLVYVMRAIPMQSSSIVVHVCCRGLAVSGHRACAGGRSYHDLLALLNSGLEAVADDLGL